MIIDKILGHRERSVRTPLNLSGFYENPLWVR
jgi:hypothetical protein